MMPRGRYLNARSRYRCLLRQDRANCALRALNFMMPEDTRNRVFPTDHAARYLSTLPQALQKAVTCTPHLNAFTREAQRRGNVLWRVDRRRVLRRALEQIKAYDEGRVW